MRVVDAAKRGFEQVREQLRFAEAIPQEMHQFQIQPGMIAPIAQRVDGWASTRAATPGVISEALTLNQGSLSYETTDYRGWAVAFKRFSSVALEAIRTVSNVVDFRVFALEYQNRFIFQGIPSEADPEQVLQPELLKILSAGAQSGQYLWHLHRGWFESDADRSILMNQNIDAQDAKSPTGQDVRALQFLTRAEFRPTPEQFDMRDIEVIADQLHSLCKDTFAASLSPTARQLAGVVR